MFFIRLAITALSFGSAVKVLAAPIAIGGSLPGSSVDAAPIVRRLDDPISIVLDSVSLLLDEILGNIRESMI
jgi:hypothetical protein